MPSKKEDPLPLPASKTIEEFVDVFISYARTDQAVARNLASLLRMEGFEVWFDDKIYAGASWKSMLMKTLASSKVILVLWSRRSVTRPWVLKEAVLAKKGKRLVPVIIDECEQPAQFAATQAAIMPGWNGKDPHPRLEQVLAGIAALAPPSRLENVRPGFDTNFLGIDVGLPSIKGVADEFRYLHFSVIMNPARRLPWYVAYNMKKTESVDRGEVWKSDPMLPAAFQPTDEHFRGTGYDRGHMAAALSVSWGSPREARLANHQAFFWTNNVPQHPDMNRGWWHCIEQWERELVTEYEKAIVFAGPVLDQEDPVLRDVEQIVGRLRLYQNFLLPRYFWKLVLVRQANSQLSFAAFFLDQNLLIKTKPQNNPANFLSTIEKIESATGLLFSDAIKLASPLPWPVK